MGRDHLVILNKASKKKKNKYGAKKIKAFGITFDSKGEYQRYIYLKGLLLDGDIQDLSHQVPFKIGVNGKHICKYVADFSYLYNGRYIVEDFKGVETSVFRLKKKDDGCD